MLRRLTVLVAITLAIGSCGGDDSPETERSADVYAAVIRALATDPPERGRADGAELDRIIYAGPLDEDSPIPIEVQAAVVEQLEDVATVRFVDERREAIDDTEDDEPVLEDGVLVLLGDVPAGRSPSVSAERYIDLDETARLRVGTERAGEVWTVTSLDVVSQTGTVSSGDA